MSADRTTDAPDISPRLAESLRYCVTTICIGRDPDNPDRGVIGLFVDDEHAPVCTAIQARMLRDLADRMDADHGEKACGI